MEEDFIKIIEAGVQAPSGDNTQPWKFKIENNRILIYNLPDKDNLYLNFKQSGSLIAHGALIENIHIASMHYGYKITENLFPGVEKNLVAELKLEKREKKKSIYYPYIFQRHTNRKTYSDKEVPADFKDFVRKDRYEGIRSYLICKLDKMTEVAEKASNAEVVILENKTLHKFLFDDVVWTKSENYKKKSGLYINTMEFNPIQKLLFFLASYWTLMRIGIYLKLPKFIAKEDTKLYSSGGCIGLITTKNTTPEGFLGVGRELQRIWLEATRRGLSLQPVSAILFFGLRSEHGKDDILSNHHKNLVTESINKLREVFMLDKNETPLMMYRVGYSQKAKFRTERKRPVVEVVYKD